jgi:thiol-disulfide isomerase/thioredoxin
MMSASASVKSRRNALLNLLIVCLLTVTSFPTLAADSLNLQQYRGKVVLVDFWASWCQPCRRSFPWLSEMQRKYQDQGLVVIGVNVDHERTDADRFLKEVPAGFTLVFDPAGTLATQYEVPGMPSSYVYGRDGVLITKHIGFRESSEAERETQIQALLAQANHSAH